jgi:Tfp pilus assembly protein PilN
VRPINLMPEEQRRSRGSSTPGGPLTYLVLGALAILLIGVVMLVLTSNQISDREAEVANLQAEKTAATAEAQRLAAYTSFQQVAEQRTRTVAELANGRFDWVRVLKELSVTLPPNVYFTNLSGSAGGGEGGSEGIGVPSLTIAGCAPGQTAVAAFVASLKVIDGVTRVELQQSAISESESGATGASACSVGRKAQFTIVVAFDEAPPSPDSSTGSAELPTTEAEPEGSESGSGESEGGESSADESGAGEAAGAESTQATTSSDATTGTG